MTRNEFKKEAAEAIIDYLEDGYTGYLCDLHNEVFNYGYYETSKYIAADWFSDYEEGVFNVIEEIKNYEQDNFGEVTTDFSDASKVLNMFWYIIGDEVMYELMDGSADCDELWNEELTEEENKLILKIFYDIPKEGTIYKCAGPFRFEEHYEDEDDYYSDYDEGEDEEEGDEEEYD